MTVHFVGAGPGAPDLLTVRAQRLIDTAPVCLYAGALIPSEILPPGAIDTPHLDHDAIVEHMRAAAAAGHDVARLQSGDLSIYSAVAEQARRLDALGIAWDLTPGVPAFAAAAAALRTELTVPEVAQTVILARHGRRASAIPPGEELASLARHRTTLVIHLGTQAIDEIAPALAEHYGPDCPAAVVARASWPDERVLRGTLADIAQQTQDAGIRRTATILVGPALAADGFRDSHLYSKARER